MNLNRSPITDPPLFTVVNEIINHVMSHVHTCLPGRIEKYDSVKVCADVKPLLNRVTNDGTVLEFPVIPSVPVVWPRTSKGSITLPLEKGDGVMLHFSESSIDEWLSKGGLVTSEDNRLFDLSDAIAVPGLWPLLPVEYPLDGKSLHVQYKGQCIKIKDDGNIEIGKEGLNPLLTEPYKTLYMDIVITALKTFLTGLNVSTLTVQASTCVGVLNGLIEPTNAVTAKVKAQ